MEIGCPVRQARQPGCLDPSDISPLYLPLLIYFLSCSLLSSHLYLTTKPLLYISIDSVLDLDFYYLLIYYYYLCFRYVERRSDTTDSSATPATCRRSSADTCRRSSADSTDSDWLAATNSPAPLIVVSSEEEGCGGTPTWMVSPELLALRHNLTFPESATASPVLRRAHRVCRKFSVDLSKEFYYQSFYSGQ